MGKLPNMAGKIRDGGCVKGECAYNRMKKMDKESGEKENKVM